MRRLLLSFSAFLALALTVMFPAPSAQAATVLVNLGDLTFTPKDVTISVGDSVRWSDESDAPHTVTSDDGREFNSNPNCNPIVSATCMSRGQTFEHKFNSAGTFAYHCTIHQQQGMVGTIRVQPAPATTTTRATATTRASATTAPGATTSTARGATTTTTEFLPGGPIDVGDTTSTSTPTGSATAKTKGGGSGSKAVVVIVAALAAISVGGGALLWRLRPRP
jgi:plastocyanin